MTDMPALKVLYGYNKSFVPNQLHQAYLDSLEGMLTELAKQQAFADGDGLAQAFAGSSTKSADLLAYAQVYNRAYMYYTNLSYYLEPTDEDILAYREEHLEDLLQAGLTEDSGNYIDIRQILILPEGTVAADGKPEDVLVDGELLTGLRLEPPFPVRLREALLEHGIELPATVNETELKEALCRLRSTR
jgi:hypothetical protein